MNKLTILILSFMLSLTITAQTGEHFAENSVVVDTFKVLSPNDFHSKVDKIVTTLLTRYHYKKIDLNDSLSSVIFDNYIKSLDYNRVYFLQSDIQSF